MRARLTQLLSILVASVLPSFVACIQNFAPAYPEITDPGISKRAADQKLAEFEKVYKNVMRVRPKNAILFIGDGMSVSTVVGARYLKAVNLGLAAGELHLEWENWPSVALVRTHNADRMTTESASSATAILGGMKAIHDVIGITGISECCVCQLVNFTSYVFSSLIMAQEAGLSTGIVTTTRVTHATPAAAYAHTLDRNWEAVSQTSPNNSGIICPDIASQMIKEGINFNVILGGGHQSFYQHPTSQTPSSAGQRTDGRNLLEEWRNEQKSRSRRHQLIFDRKALLNLNASETDYLLGLFSASNMDFDILRTDQPSLSEMVSVAIQILSRNPKGFLLLVEGGRIDHGHHYNMAKVALTDTLAMESAVLTAANATNPNETLIMVTADHAHSYGIVGYATRKQNMLDVDDTAKGDDGMHYLISTYFNGPGAKVNAHRDEPMVQGRFGDFAKQQALVPLKYSTHTAEDVPLYATGPLNEIFQGTIDNTYIAYVTMYALCFGPYKNSTNCSDPV